MEGVNTIGLTKLNKHTSYEDSRHTVPVYPRPFLLVGLAGAVARASAGVILDWNIAMTSYSESLPPPGMR